MIPVRNMLLVLQKSKQVKTRVDLKPNRVGSKIGIVSLSVIRTVNDWVAIRCFKHRTFKPVVRIEANVGTYSSSLTISLMSPLITLAYFYEI